MSIFERSNLIFKHEQGNLISILGEDSKLIGTVYHGHSNKMPKVVGNLPLYHEGRPVLMRTTDIGIEGENGEYLGGINEIATGTMRVIRRWQIYDQKDTIKGEVTEKPKFIGSDWVLNDVKYNLLAVAEGDRKKHNYEIVAPDKGKQCIARCSSIDKDSYRVEVMTSNIDPLLVISYVIVLDLAKTAYVVTRGGMF